MAGKYGTKNAEEMVEFGHALGEGIDAMLEDDKVTMSDTAHAFPVLQKAPAAFGDLDVMAKELGELDDEDHAKLKAKIAEADFDEDLAEVIYEESLNLGLSVAKVINAVREHKNRKAAAPEPEPAA